MKTIGIIGGMSWESTVTYYEIINKITRDKLGGLHSAKLLISSIDFYELERLQKMGRWEDAGLIILREALRLQDAGSDLIVICSGTGHEPVERIKGLLNIPIVHMADALGQALNSRGIKKVGFLGTIYSMEKDYILGPLKQKFNIEIVVPKLQDRAVINDIIYNELCLGIISSVSRDKYLAIIDNMIKQGLNAIVLGCTEIQLLISEQDVNIPIIDATLTHASFVTQLAIQDESK
jgi:aspartate racemase